MRNIFRLLVVFSLGISGVASAENTKPVTALNAASQTTNAPSQHTIEKGLNALLNSQYKQAEQYFKEALSTKQTKQKAQYYLARLYLETQQFDLAIEHTQQILINTPDDLDALILMGHSSCQKAMTVSLFKAFKLGKQCIKHYTLAADKHPTSPRALSLASQIFLTAPSVVGGSKKKGDFYFSQLEALSAEHADTLRVNQLSGAGKTKQANALAIRLSQAPFQSAENHYAIARYFQLKRDLATANQLYTSLSRKLPDIDSKWHINDSLLQLGEVNIAQGNVKDGVVLIQQYQSRNQNTFDKHYFWASWILATGYKKLGDAEKYRAIVAKIKSENYRNDENFAKEFESHL